MKPNSLYTIKFRDCMNRFGWSDAATIQLHIQTLPTLELTGYFAYEDEHWYVLAATSAYNDQWLSPSFIPKAAIVEVKEL